MTEDLFKIVGIMLISFCIIYFVVKLFHLHTTVIEGLTNIDGTTSTTNTGEAGSAAAYAAAIKAETVKIQDSLIITKYRADYEKIIINLDDYIGMLMLKTSLNMIPHVTIPTDKANNTPEKLAQIELQNVFNTVTKLNALRDSRIALNETMVFLDKQ